MTSFEFVQKFKWFWIIWNAKKCNTKNHFCLLVWKHLAYTRKHLPKSVIFIFLMIHEMRSWPVNTDGIWNHDYFRTAKKKCNWQLLNILTSLEWYSTANVQAWYPALWCFRSCYSPIKQMLTFDKKLFTVLMGTPCSASSIVCTRFSIFWYIIWFGCTIFSSLLALTRSLGNAIDVRQRASSSPAF